MFDLCNSAAGGRSNVAAVRWIFLHEEEEDGRGTDEEREDKQGVEVKGNEDKKSGTRHGERQGEVEENKEVRNERKKMRMRRDEEIQRFSPCLPPQGHE